jgi:hypothetical protein
MQNNIAVHDREQKEGNPMHNNRNSGKRHKEKPMNAITKVMSVAVLAALGTGTVTVTAQY